MNAHQNELLNKSPGFQERTSFSLSSVMLLSVVLMPVIGNVFIMAPVVIL